MKKKRQPIIGVMGPGNPGKPEIVEFAENLGRKIAEQKWILLTGGRKAGVMDAASKGAFEAGGTVLGILPDENRNRMSEYVTIPILTGMGHARNVMNILTTDVIVICGMGAGTASEAALAIKNSTPVIFSMVYEVSLSHFAELTGKDLLIAESVDEVIQCIRDILISCQL